MFCLALDLTSLRRQHAGRSSAGPERRSENGCATLHLNLRRQWRSSSSEQSK